jgi:hypothetical protein
MWVVIKWLILKDDEDRHVRIHKYKSTVNGNNKELLLTVKFILVFTERSNDKFVAVRNEWSKIPPPSSMLLCISWAYTGCSSSELIFTCLCAGSSIQNVNQQFVWCIYLSNINFTFYLTAPTKSNGFWYRDWKSFMLITVQNYVSNSISKIQIQLTTYVF